MDENQEKTVRALQAELKLTKTKLEELSSAVIKTLVLLEEVNHIKSQIKPQDCGHLKTTVSVLEERIKANKKYILNRAT